MKFKLIIIACFFFGSNFISAQKNINKFNDTGERIGVWKKYYSNKRIRYQGQFSNGKETGVFNYYSALNSKHPTVIKTFNLKNDIASVKFYTTNGLLESEGAMQGKTRIGTWLYFHADGKTIMTEENYNDGMLNGISKTYYKTGKPTEILYFKNGKLHGNIKRFADNGNLLDDLNYDNGILNGLAAYYNVDGKLIYTGNYENDEKVGKWEYYDDGKQ